MKYKYKSFIDEVWSQFPGLSDRHVTDVTDHNILWSLDDYINVGYVNFKTSTNPRLAEGETIFTDYR